MAHTCCDDSSDAPKGCSNVADPFNEEHPLEGNCYKNSLFREFFYWLIIG